MKRIIIPFVAAFGLSLGIATGVVMMRAPKVVPIAASIAPKTADSTAAGKDSAVAQTHDSVTATDTTAGPPTNAAPTIQPAATVAGEAAQKHETAPTPKSHEIPASGATPSSAKLATAPAASRSVTPEAPRPISDSLINRRLAQVFAAMQPKDAARVLEQMNDTDVRAILGSLSSKQQAAILGSFPTQRAALIVQTTLRTASTGGTQ